MGYYAKDEAGTTFWVDDQGKPSRVDTGNAGFPTVTIGARDPGKARAEARADASQVREDQARKDAHDAAARAAEAEDRRRREFEATHNPDGSAKVPLAAVPATAAAGIQENLKTLRSIDAAIAGLAGRPQSIGPTTGLLGERFTQWHDPDGVNTRATLGAVGAYKIHDLSGAAVSASEAPRFSPFVPSVSDQPEAARTKLQNFRRELVGQLREANDFYSPTNNFRGYNTPGFSEAIRQAEPQATPALAGPQPATPKHGEYTADLTADGLDIRPVEQKPSNPSQSYFAQGTSGVNEGIAGVLGAPIDLTTAAMNLVPRGINAAADTQLPTIQKPFAGSQWWKDLMNGWAIRAPSDDPSKQFVRRVGESIGGALVPMGMAGTAGKAGAQLLAGVGGGLGAATAQQVFPGNPWAEVAGEVAGGGLTGAGLAKRAQREAQRGIEGAIPTVDQLKDQAGELYRSAEARGVTADPTLTNQLADDFGHTLRSEGQISPTGRVSGVYPKVEAAHQMVQDYRGQPMNPTQMQTVRGVAADGMNSKDSKERRLASILTDTFDNWSEPLAPELPQARDIASRYLNAQQLEQARELAGARAGQFSGSGFENALRTEYRGMDRAAIKGNGRYSDVLHDAIQDVSRGTPASNAARNIGKLAPTGVVSAGLGSGVPAGLGMAMGGPGMAVALGGGAAALGTAGRLAATGMGIRNADIAELIARNGGAIPQAQFLTPEVQKMIDQYAAGQASKYLAPSGDR